MKIRHILLAVLLAGAFIYVTTWGPRSFHRWQGPLPWESNDGPVAGVTLAQSGGLSPDEQNNIQIYQAASPAVVNITTITLSYDFFLNPVPVEGAGSGFLIDPQGDIVTNSHVVADQNGRPAREVKVTLADKRTVTARVVGFDPPSDIALLKIEAGDKLPSLQLGDSTHLQVGQKVLAIGNPFGEFQNTLTTGVVSSIGRKVRDQRSGTALEDVIQIDAAINPGNSGGPLLDSRGKVIGINTAIIGPTNLGIGFAIPVNQVRLIVADLLKEGRVLRPELGVATLPLNSRVAEILNLPVGQGLLVLSVVPGSSAERAGIRGGDQVAIVGRYRIPIGGDILTVADGDPLESSEDLKHKIEIKRPGDTVKLTLYRSGKKMDLNVRLEAPASGRL